MNGELTQLAAAITALQRYPVWNTATDDSAALVAAAQVAITQLTVLQALHARELAGRDHPARQGATSLTVWLRDRARISVYSARRLVKLGEYLDAHEPVAEAMAAGAVTVEQAEVIRDAIADLPRDLDPVTRGDCETALIAHAGVLEPAALRVIGERILTHVAPEVAEAALLAKLQRDEDNAHRARGFTMTPQGHGIVRISGSLDTESAAIIRAAIEPLCAPRRPGTGPHGNATTPGRHDSYRNLPADPAHPSTTGTPASGLPGTGLPGTGLPGTGLPGTGLPGTELSGTEAPGANQPSGDPLDDHAPDNQRDPRSAARRRADALVDICALILAGADLPANGGTRPQLTATFHLNPLTATVSAGTLDTGETLSPTTIRRLACDAAIIPAILGSHSEILDLGRSRRLYTGPARHALTLRDQGCAFPGCDRPPRWTEAHHIVSWLNGGPTDQNNGALLCRRHHRAVHHDGWKIRITNRIPEFIPPTYIDPHQRPLRNHRYHARL